MENLHTLRTWGAGRDAKARDAGGLALAWLANGDLERMATAARVHAIPDAADRVFGAIEKCVPGKLGSESPEHVAKRALAYAMHE